METFAIFFFHLSAILAKCLTLNVLRLIIVILFFIAFLNIT
ncbi:tyrosine-type recombinase/integrase, partial [Bacteroides hominis]